MDPGTGQNPIKVSETADRVLSKVIDYAQSRPEIDKNRHCAARRKLGRVLGDEDGHRGAGAAAWVQRAVSAGG